jgi:hypothetical protein
MEARMAKNFTSEFMMCMLSGVRVTAADTILLIKSCLKTNTINRNDLLTLYEIFENGRTLLNIIEREMNRIDDLDKQLNDAEGTTEDSIQG